ncbi:hypothetical protein GCM10027405_03600 [Arthrobacter alkaliphilus]
MEASGVLELAPGGNSGTRPFDPRTKRLQQTIDTLKTALRSQSSELERFERVFAEQQAREQLLRDEIVRLKRTQRSNIEDLAHVAGRLVSLHQAKSIGLDVPTIDILRRRGWMHSRQKSPTTQP